MSNFTEQQANACVINRCESVKRDNVHQYWVLEVLDADGNIYGIEDKTCAADADNATLKTCIKDTLLLTEKKPAPPVISNTTKEDIIGDTIG